MKVIERNTAHKVYRFENRLAVVLQVPNDEEPSRMQTGLLGHLHGVRNLAERDVLLDGVQHALRTAFDSIADLPTAGLLHAFEELQVAVIDAAVTGPGEVDAIGQDVVADLQDAILMIEEVVIVYADIPYPVRLHQILDHAGDVMGAKAPQIAVHRLAIAENASSGATPGGHDGCGGEPDVGRSGRTVHCHVRENIPGRHG